MLRKSLKSIVNQTKLKLMKKITSLKKFDKSCERKESELDCFKRIEVSEIPLSLGIHPDQLQKTLTDGSSSEIDRAYARILLNPILQKTLVKIKEAKGVELSEKILQRNENTIKQTALKKIDKKRVEKLAKSDDSKVSNGKKLQKVTKDKNKVKKKAKNPVVQSESDEEDEAMPKIADPFFVDVNNGSNYLATATNAKSESSSNEEVEAKLQQPRKKIEPHKMKRQVIERNNAKQQGVYRPAVVKKRILEPQPTVKTDELHPSWIAKQQQKKLQIQEFQGTKIKFD